MCFNADGTGCSGAGYSKGTSQPIRHCLRTYKEPDPRGADGTTPLILLHVLPLCTHSHNLRPPLAAGQLPSRPVRDAGVLRPVSGSFGGSLARLVSGIAVTFELVSVDAGHMTLLMAPRPLERG